VYILKTEHSIEEYLNLSIDAESSISLQIPFFSVFILLSEAFSALHQNAKLRFDHPLKPSKATCRDFVTH